MHNAHSKALTGVQRAGDNVVTKAPREAEKGLAGAWSCC